MHLNLINYNLMKAASSSVEMQSILSLKDDQIHLGSLNYSETYGSLLPQYYLTIESVQKNNDSDTTVCSSIYEM